MSTTAVRSRVGRFVVVLAGAAVGVGASLAPVATVPSGAVVPSAVTTTILRPDGDVVRQWSGTPGSAWTALDDPLTQPTSVDSTDYIYGSRAGTVTEVTLASSAVGGATGQVTPWFFANTGPGTQLRVEAVSRGAVVSSTVVAAGGGFAWRALPAATLGQPEIDDLRLRFSAVGGGDTNVRAAYAAVVGDDCAAGTTFGAGSWPPACWRSFAGSSPFYQPIPADAATAPNSAAIVARMRRDIPKVAAGRPDAVPGNISAASDGELGEPTYYARSGDPRFGVSCYRFACPTLTAQPVPVPAGAVPEGGPQAADNPTGANGGDRHITSIDRAAGVEYDMWQVQATSPLPATGGPLTVGSGGTLPLSGPGLSAGVTGTAAQVANSIGRVRIEELQAGRITHAIAIVVNCDNGQTVYPATGPGRPIGVPGPSGATHCAQTADAPPLGSLFQLTSTPAQIDALAGVAAWQKTILRAMHDYGMYFVDTGSSGTLFNVETEAGIMYTSQGATDPWYALFRGLNQAGPGNNVDYYVPPNPAPGEHEYVGRLSKNVDWYANLRVVAPCAVDPAC